VGDDSQFLFRQKLLGEDGSVRLGVVMVKQPGLFSPKFEATFFARFHAVAAKLRSRTRNSQIGPLEKILCATTTAV
jgi:lipase chaperone LimK